MGHMRLFRWLVISADLRVRNQKREHQGQACYHANCLSSGYSIVLRASRHNPADKGREHALFGKAHQAGIKNSSAGQKNRQIDAAGASAFADLMDGSQNYRHREESVDLRQSSSERAAGSGSKQEKRMSRQPHDHATSSRILQIVVIHQILQYSLTRRQFSANKDGDIHGADAAQKDQDRQLRCQEIAIGRLADDSFDTQPHDNGQHGVGENISTACTRETASQVECSRRDQNEQKTAERKERRCPFKKLNDQQQGGKDTGSPERDPDWKR